MLEVVERFGRSKKRREILRGLLRLRKEINDNGFMVGFQWLDGSFLDLLPTEPNDVDVVTFYQRPDGMSDLDLRTLLKNKKIFLGPKSKKDFECDSYGVELRAGDATDAAALVEQTHFWFGLFSHSRTHVWRGIVQVASFNIEDDEALQKLDELESAP